MTFEEWKRTGQRRESVAAECGWDLPGHLYEGGFIVDQDGRYVVPICNDEWHLTTLEGAERCLWSEWIRHELRTEDKAADPFEGLRVAGTLEALYQDYCRQIREATIASPNNRRWLACVVFDAPGLMRQSHPDLYADLDC